MRARVVGVSGSETNLEGADDVRQRGVSIGREFTITYRDRLESNERVVQGAFWNGPSAEAEVSVEQQIADRARLHVGDTMRVLERVLTTKLSSEHVAAVQPSVAAGLAAVPRGSA